MTLQAHTPASAAAALVSLVQDGLSDTSVHLCNADVLSRAHRDDAYRSVLERSRLNLPDGAPVVWTARRLGLDEAMRVPGSELFLETIELGSRVGLRHYLYGSTEDVLERLQRALRARSPDAKLAEVESPPFRDLTDDEVDELAGRIRESRADIVWIGLGTPRQDQLIARLRGRVDAVLVAVGAAFDFLGGSKQRAPAWMQGLGLEWLHRLLSEPGRLWKRYLVGNISYIAAARRTARLIERNEGQIADLRASRQRRTRPGASVIRLLLAGDVLAIGLASILAYWVRVELDPALGVFQTELPVAVAVLPLWLGILGLFGCYRPEYQNQSSEAFRRFLAGTTVAVLVLGFVSFLFVLDLSRLYVGLVFLFVLLLGTIVRTGIRRYLHQRREAGQLLRRVIVVGANDEAQQVAAAMSRYRIAGYEVVGFAADDPRSGGIDDLPVLGPPDDILELAGRHGVDLVVLSPTAVPAGTLQDITIALEDSDVDVAVAPSLFEVVTRRVSVESVANVPILHVDQIRLEGWKAATKRLFDLVMALVLGVLLLPVTVAAAITVKVHDGGPIVFRQPRVGQDGRVFVLYKFRTMVPEAESRLVHVENLNEVGGHFFKIREDPRVTWPGRFLRKWSIDELPQLWNVIRGDMSLVGPRPPLPSEVVVYEPWHRRRLRIKPGITGVWQVSGRSEVPFDEAVRLDLFYIENWSLAYDIYLLAKTVPAVLGRSGAY